MIIFEDSFIKLTYDLTIDTLFVDMPTVDSAFLPVVSHALDIVVDHVRHYDIKKMVIDARDSKIFVNEDHYAAMIFEFSHALMGTHMKKIARIVKENSPRESVVRKIYDDKGLSIEVHSFPELTTALSWLKSNN